MNQDHKDNAWLKSLGLHLVLILLIIIGGFKYKSTKEVKVKRVSIRLSAPLKVKDTSSVGNKNKSVKVPHKVIAEKKKTKSPIKIKKKIVAKKKLIKKTKLKAPLKKPSKKLVKKTTPKQPRIKSNSNTKKMQVKKTEPVLKKKAVKQKPKPKKLSKLLHQQTLSQINQALLEEQSLLDREDERLIDEAFLEARKRVLGHLRAYWKVPAGLKKGVFLVVEVLCDRKGRVMDVKLIKSSGNSALDRSSKRAVLNSSPLPLPDRKELQPMFKQFQLTLKP